MDVEAKNLYIKVDLFIEARMLKKIGGERVMRKISMFLTCFIFMLLFVSCRGPDGSVAGGAGELDARIMSVFRVDGDSVSVRNIAGAQSEGRSGMRLHAGYAVSTGLASFCYIQLDTDSLVKMDVSTEIMVGQINDRLLRINIDRGQVLVNVQNQSPGHELEAIIGNTVISVRGTLFVAGVYAGGEAIITVLDCSVYVNERRLDAGFTMRVFDGIEMIYEIEPIDFETADDFLLSAAGFADVPPPPTAPTPETLPVPAPALYAVGDIIQFGNYDWRVLDVQGNQALIITDRVIGHRWFHHSHEAVTWETSDIRQWLNGEFFASFSLVNQARIVETYVVNHDNPWCFADGHSGHTNTQGGNNTVDRIFLLSIDEVLRYFGDSGLVARGATMGEIARADDIGRWFASGMSDEYNENRVAMDLEGLTSFWWLRSPGRNPNYAARVRHGGDISIIGYPTFREGIVSRQGIRPALWLNLEY